MKLPSALALGVCLVAMSPVPSSGQGSSAVPLAQASPSVVQPPVVLPPADVVVPPAEGVVPSAEGVVPPRATVEPTFEDRVAIFVSTVYLSSEMKTNEELELIYASQVAYFDKSVWSRSRVMADKRAYFARWPRRSYRLIRDSLRTERREGEGRVYDVAFNYEFAVASSRRESRGRGRASLTIDLDDDGGRITREAGAVLSRW